MIVLEVDFKGFSRGFLNGAWINFGKNRQRMSRTFLKFISHLKIVQYVYLVHLKNVPDKRMILSFSLCFVEIQKVRKMPNSRQKSIIEQVLFG